MLPGIELALDGDFRENLSGVPASPGVLLIEFEQVNRYAARTANLRRRFSRLLGDERAGGAELRAQARGAFYQPTGSAFESSLRLYELAREVWPDAYRKRLHLRPAPFVKAHLNNRFPRTSVTTRLGGSSALYFGPFPTRIAAERFEEGFLDQFLIRRCVENLKPELDHPGCIYGEMNMCLRPCQQVCSDEEYRAESGRAVAFLASRGVSLVDELEGKRNSASDALEFEEAAGLHQRLDKLRELLSSMDELAHDLDALHGAVVQRSADPSEVVLWPLYRGLFQDAARVSIVWEQEKPGSLDRRVREALDAVDFKSGRPADQADHLALLRRWRMSSYRRGELVVFDSLERIPYRRLVNAVSRVAQGKERR